MPRVSLYEESVDETYIQFSVTTSGFDGTSKPSTSGYDEGDLIYIRGDIFVECSSNNELVNYSDGINYIAHDIPKNDTNSYSLIATVAYTIYELIEESGGTTYERAPESGYFLSSVAGNYPASEGWEEHIVPNVQGGNGYYYTREIEGGASKYWDIYDNDIVTDTIYFQVYTTAYIDFKFLNTSGKALSKGDEYSFSEFITEGIPNLRDFQEAAETYVGSGTCPSWGSTGSFLTANAVNNIYEYVGLGRPFSKGDKITFELFDKLQRTVRGE